MNLLIIFIILNIVNVILQTARSLATVKCGKVVAALVSAVAYGLYTIVIVYTVCDIPLYLKVIVVAVCNLIGVYIVKYFEEKAKRDKLWKVELTVKDCYTDTLIASLDNWGIPYNYILGIGKWTLFNVYCATQDESKFVKVLADKSKAKYFVTESKIL